MGEALDGEGRVVEILVVALHVANVSVGYGYVVGKFGGAEDLPFTEGGGPGEEAFGCVGAIGRGGG